MTTDELKTFVFAGLEEKAKDVNPSEVLHALDSAYVYLVRLLPWKLVPELIISAEADTDPTGKAQFEAPEALVRPTDLLELISVKWEPLSKIPSMHPDAILSGSELVSLSEFLAAIDKTTDLISTDAGNTILLNRTLGSGWDTEILNRVTYKVTPTALASTDPEINVKWHQHMIELALADLWLKLGDNERSAYYNKKFFERMGGSQQPERNVAR